MKFWIAAILLTGVVSAQEPANPLVATSKAVYANSKNDVLGSLESIPDNLWSYQPTKAVRTVGQLFAHVADGQYEFCSPVAEGRNVSKDIEKNLHTKAEVGAALKEAFAYCDAAYSKLTDADAAQLVPFFGRKMTKLGILDFNTAHNMEHYGNLVTYMRINGIVPPSSRPRPPASAKKN